MLHSITFAYHNSLSRSSLLLARIDDVTHTVVSCFTYMYMVPILLCLYTRLVMYIYLSYITTISFVMEQDNYCTLSVKELSVLHVCMYIVSCSCNNDTTLSTIYW